MDHRRRKSEYHEYTNRWVSLGCQQESELKLVQVNRFEYSRGGGTTSAFLRMFRELPNIDAILLNPLQEPVPENAAAQYAVASALARCASDTNFDRICLYLNRLPTEFRVLCVRDATLRQPAIRTTAGFVKFAIENHHAIA